MTPESLFDEMLDTLYSLIRVMEEESEQLATAGPSGASEELAQAKIRLASGLDGLSARLDRNDAGWMNALDAERHGRLAEASEELHKAAAVNSAILERQIELSTEMLQAVGLEMERLTGRRGTTYGRLGDIRRAHLRAPLSINQKF